MSRSTKYRVWDGEKMHYGIFVPRKIEALGVADEVLGITLNGDLIYSVQYDGCGTQKWPESLIRMQLTSLLDSEGTEIYEGDRLVLAGEYADGDTSAFTVVWVDGAFRKGYDDWSEAVGYPLLYDRLDMWRVVGNIYESELVDG